MTAPAGWYPDPDGSGGRRYFDGQRWTHHRTPPPAPAAEEPVLPAASTEPAPTGQNSKAVAGAIVVVILLLVAGVAALVVTRHTDVGDATLSRRPADESAQTSVAASKAETAQKAPAAEGQPGTIGQPVRDGNFEFVVTGLDRTAVVSDTEFPELQKAAEGEYVLVKVTVTNIGTEPQTFFASFNTLSDGTTQYQSDDQAWIYLGNTLADLNPGDSVDTEVVFDVPVGTEPLSIELHEASFSKGVTVEL